MPGLTAARPTMPGSSGRRHKMFRDPIASRIILMLAGLMVFCAVSAALVNLELPADSLFSIGADLLGLGLVLTTVFYRSLASEVKADKEDPEGMICGLLASLAGIILIIVAALNS